MEVGERIPAKMAGVGQLHKAMVSGRALEEMVKELIAPDGADVFEALKPFEAAEAA